MRQHAILSCFILSLAWLGLFAWEMGLQIHQVPNPLDKIVLYWVFPLSVFAFVKQTDRLKHCVFRSSKGGFALACLALLAYAFFQLNHLPKAAFLSLLMVLPCLVLMSLGKEACRINFFSLASLMLLSLAVYPLQPYLESLWYQNSLGFSDEVLESLVLLDKKTNLPLLWHSVDAWIILSVFYAYFRYPVLHKALLCLLWSLGIFTVLMALQWGTLLALTALGGTDLIQRLSLYQFTLILFGIGCAWLWYLEWAVIPKSFMTKRFSVSGVQFAVLIDRQSRWLKLTLSSLFLMLLTVIFIRYLPLVRFF